MIPALLSLLLMAAPQAKNVLKNGGFERGPTGWKIEGTASVDDGSLRLGRGISAARQRYDVPGLRILWFGATLKATEEGATARLRLQCFDAENRVVMDLQGGPDPKTHAAAIYLKTQARTKYVVVSIEGTSDRGELLADDAVLTDEDRNRVEHAPQFDLDAAMRPFWRGKRVEDESVLLLSQGGGTPSGRLLFRPTRIVSVRDATLRKTYRAGTDYRIQENVLSAVPGSGITTFDDAQLAKGEYPWTPLEGRHVFVTYEHDQTWTAAIPAYAGDHLTETIGRLRAKRPLRVVAYGDSITLGMSVSSYRSIAPYMPPWPTLFVRAVGKAYGHGKIELMNAALGGMNSYWARDNARDAVASLDPDLVLIAFGMNDFWSISTEEFRKNIESTVATIRARKPGCEFLLVSPMRFDPAYTADPTYVGHVAGYADELRKLVGPGVALFDMTTLSGALYEAKSAKDLGTDPMHPNDFLSRVYAQGAAATLIRP